LRRGVMGDGAQAMTTRTTPARLTREGTWRQDDLRHAFVAGARWWEVVRDGMPMWPGEPGCADVEAERRYPGGRLARRPRGRET